MPQEDTEQNELALPPGFELGNYIIQRSLGLGGFGITYLAYDSALETEVVIKENLPTMFARRSTDSRQVYAISQNSADFEWANSRFLQEARTLAKLNHRNIVRVMRIFEALGTAYYVMPYVGGSSLDKVTEQEGPLTPERIKALLNSLLDALAYLHSKNLLHRDIKPANILLDDEGEPILIDFGAARQISQHSQTVMESPGYTPFEQIQTHGEVGPWSDLYALGGTMYKLITGKAPLRSTDRVGMDGQPQLTNDAELCKRYSKSLLAGIDRALAFSPSKRWQSAGEWRNALGGNTGQTRSPQPQNTPVAGAPSAAPKSPRRGLLLWGGVAAGLLLLLAASFLLIPRDRLLLDYAANGNPDRVALMLSLGADPEAKDRSGRTPLLSAAAAGHKDVVQLLLEQSADYRARDARGATAPHIAAQNGHAEIVALLLRRGADPGTTDSNGLTPEAASTSTEVKKILNKAIAKKEVQERLRNQSADNLLLASARNGNTAFVELLLEQGDICIEAKDSEGRTPLMAAVSNGHRDTASVLLENGADPRARDRNNRTPLLLPVAADRGDMVRFLLEKHANLAAKDNEEKTPLLLAAQQGSEEVVRLLLDGGAAVEDKDKDGRTPLLAAALRGHEGIVRLLLREGADLAARDCFRNTPLINAASKGHETVVRLLLEKGAAPEARDSSGQTPLIAAADRGHRDVVRLLLEKGANPEARRNNGDTALAAATSEEVQELLSKAVAAKELKTLLQYQSADDILLSSSRYGTTAIVEVLLDQNRGNIEARDKEGETPLILAARGGHADTVRLLLDKGATIDARTKHNSTALHMAADGGHENIARLLLEKGAMVDAKTNYDSTPLLLSANDGHEDVVRLLLDHGAYVNATDQDGGTPLHWAAQKGYYSVVRLLLEKGASIDARTKYGSTPLILAAKEGHESVVRLLLEKGANVSAKISRGDTAYDLAKKSSIKQLIRSYQR